MLAFDPKKPRFRKDYGSLIKLVNRSFFKIYHNRYKKSSIDTYQKMREVLAALHNKVTDVVATERSGFDLGQLANIITVAYTPSIKSVSEDKKYINYSKSKEIQKPVKYLNLHTDGKSCRIFFSMDIPKYKFTYRTLWGFTPVLSFKRKVSKEFSKNHLRFIELIPGNSIRKILQATFK